MYRTIVLTTLLTVTGCHYPHAPGYYSPGLGPVGQALPNPIFVPVANHPLAWDQLVDVVDDYFRVDREERVKQLGEVLTEGRIDTFPQGSATLFEPHRGDSVGRFNRLESTLQTVRRQAFLRVMPADGGYLVEVQVEKQLEAMSQPERSTSGSATFRNDNAFDSQRSRDREPALAVRDEIEGRTWIPQGRDPMLEQVMLGEIAARFGWVP